MVNFSKILGLAGTVMVFTGLAYGQNGSCTSASAAQVPLIRIEGTTELVGELTINCGAAPNPIPAGGAIVNMTVILSQPVTSKVLSGGNSEAIASVNGILGTQGTATVAGYTQGTYAAGSTQLVFSNVFLPAGADTITLANIRVNANALPTTGGTPTSVTETVFISGANLNANVLAGTAVAYGLSGLLPQSVWNVLGTPPNYTPTPAVPGVEPSGNNAKGPVNPTVCNALSFPNILASLTIGENFPTAFKGSGSGAGGISTNTTLGSEFTNNTESGVAFGTPAAANGANSATFISIAFANIPANVSVYLPLTIPSDQINGGTLSLQTAASGGFAPATAASGKGGTSATTSLLSVTGGAGTAYYLYVPGTASASTQETYNVGVYAVTAAAAVVPTTTAITAQVSFAPVGVSGNIPSFSTLSASSPTLTLSTFGSCSTSLLFPFVTNQLGFDTGIAISNTTTDPYSTKAQSGTCTLYFYGAGAPSPNSIVTPSIGLPTTTPNVSQTYAAAVSGLAPGFQGYVIATCNFQLAHGFAFITDGVGTTSGIAEGYLAGVLNVTAGTRTIGGTNANESVGN